MNLYFFFRLSLLVSLLRLVWLTVNSGLKENTNATFTFLTYQPLIILCLIQYNLNSWGRTVKVPKNKQFTLQYCHCYHAYFQWRIWQYQGLSGHMATAVSIPYTAQAYRHVIDLHVYSISFKFHCFVGVS